MQITEKKKRKEKKEKMKTAELIHVTTFREAPPTRNPSTSGCAASSLQFAPFTEPAVFVGW